MNKVTLRHEKTAFLSALIVGLFAHGYVFLHNIQLHDNVYNFYLGGTLNLGRWMLFLCNSLMNKINGNYYHYQAPWYLGVISLTFTAMAAAVVCNLLRLKNKLSCIAVGAIMVSFPAVTSMYAYMFTAALYSLGLLLTIVGVWLICTGKKWFMRLVGIAAVGCGVGMYQMYISVFLALFLMYFFVEIYDEKEKKTIKTISLRALYYLAVTASIMIFYYAVLKICLWHYNVELSTYRGMSGGLSGVKDYLSGAAKAYTLFFAPLQSSTDNMYQNNLIYFYWIMVVLSVAGVVFAAIRKFMKNKAEAVVLVLATCFMPLAFNFVYVMTSEDIYSLMMYGEVMFFVWCVVLSEYVEFELRNMSASTLKNKKGIVKDKLCLWLKKGVMYCLPVFVLFFAFMYARISNICYLKADEMQTAAVSYFTRMVEKIESLPGYTEETPVLFVNYTHKADSTVFGFYEFDNETKIYPYNNRTITNDYNWMNFMIMTTGWKPVIADEEMLSTTNRESIDAMSYYPDDGSVAIVDGVVIVKFEPVE